MASMTRRLHLDLLPDWLARGDGHGLLVITRSWRANHLEPTETGALGYDDEAFASASSPLPQPGVPRRADVVR
jgi:hypothetical protein